MKKMKNMTVYFMMTMIVSPFILLSQDSIHTKDLIPFSYSFDLVNGKLSGEGGQILHEAISSSDILLLGNNSRDQMESDLSITIAQLLNDIGYTHMMIETGTQSANQVNKTCRTSAQTSRDFKKLNRQYGFQRGDLIYTPIPEFKNVEAAEFIDLLHNENWSIGGFGTESWTSYKMITDAMYNRIPPYNQDKYKDLYLNSMQVLDSLYQEFSHQKNQDIFNLCDGIKESIVYNRFLDAMSLFDQNEQSIKDLTFSLNYWWMYGKKQFYEKNKMNAINNKRQLKTALDKWQFNFNQDKLFVKMWHGHLAKGQTRNGFYGIGNTLLELSDYHNRKSLVIAVFRRHYKEGDELKDILEESSPYFKDVIALGQADKWTLIDIRPFNEVFYWGSRPYGKALSILMSRYDMILIPKADYKTEYNY